MIVVVAALVAGALFERAVDAQSRQDGQPAAPALVRDVIYVLNRDAGQIDIAVDTVVRYEAGSSSDNLTFYVDLFETTIGPALAVQRIAPDDPLLRQIRVLQTAPTSTRVAIVLKVPQVPEMEVAPALA